MMQVKIFSHNFAVTGYNRYGYDFLKRFGTANFGEVDFRAIRINKMPSRFGKKPLPTIKKTYAACTSDGREFRFHRNTLDLFKEAVSNNPELSDKVTYVEEPMYTPKKVGLKLLSHWVPRDNQVPLISYFNAPGSTKILNLQTGGGKALENNSPVLTPTGWKPIGDIRIGDLVITPKGNAVSVLGVYPQGKVDLYRFELVDGRFVNCCPSHLWTVRLNRNGPKRTITTETLVQCLKAGDVVEIPQIEMFNGFVDTKPEIDPYVFGFLYTNARTYNRRLRGYGIRAEQSVVDKMAVWLRYYGAVIREGSLCGYASSHVITSPPRKDINARMRYREVFEGFEFGTLNPPPIPDCYIHGSAANRRKLLDGLLDGLTGRGMLRDIDTWCIGNSFLRGLVKHLCFSLGYTVDNDVLNPKCVRLVLKREPYIQIKSIKSTHRAEATCIKVNDPDRLFVTDNFIVTHNTFCSLASAAHHDERICVCIESRFFNLWAEALSPSSKKQVLDLTDDEVLWIQGSKDLKALLHLAIAGELDGIKVIVVALRTMANYIETYLRFGEEMLSIYPVLPINFHRAIDAGTALKDEVHLSLHANFMEELFTHAPRRFSLSATLEDGSFKDKIFGIMFPMDQRFDAGPLKKYIDVTAIKYRLRDSSKVKYSVRGSSDYNHNAYEQWIISDRGRLNNYLKLILNWVERRFLERTYFEGQKAVVFVSSIEMATEVWKFLKKSIPNWSVSRYAASAGDDYDESKQADIMVTTEKSFSTGFDLPGLVCALLTVSINSFNTNVQILGRLREIADHPEIAPIFDYLVCENIQRHLDYHEEKKRTIFRDRVKSHKEKYANIVV